MGALCASLLILASGYGAIWNLNYLGLLAVHERLFDSALKASDIRIYEWLLGKPIGYLEFFPVVRSPFALTLLENSYLMFFTELIAIVFILARDRERLTHYFVALFICYGIGLVVFLVYPVVRPTILPGIIPARISDQHDIPNHAPVVSGL